MAKLTPDMLNANARIIDIKPGNRVKSVCKQANGDLLVTQHSGNTFTVEASHELFQAFVVYSVLAEL